MGNSEPSKFSEKEELSLDNLEDLIRTASGLGESGVKELSITELRHMRDAFQTCETAISLVRRVSQGWLDIVNAGVEAKSRGNVSSDSEISALIERLPDILTSTSPKRGSNVRPLSVSTTGVEHNEKLERELMDRLGSFLGGKPLGTLSELTTPEAKELSEKLSEFERNLSITRHQCHQVIDSLQDEIVQRYKSGEVRADEWLN
ncbi:MAG: hypothetical protein HKL80_06200 [Acidimicrobiales bacterium]|nr:hypothetical protein [Acidimicrobiales bacterium]